MQKLTVISSMMIFSLIVCLNGCNKKSVTEEPASPRRPREQTYSKAWKWKDNKVAEPKVESKAESFTQVKRPEKVNLVVTDVVKQRYNVDAMVGQINGKPIYADKVFDELGKDMLINLGSSVPRVEFKRQATNLITRYLHSRVTNSLILAESEYSLSEREQLGLLSMLKTEREKLLSQHGKVLAEAEKAEMKETGRTLDQAMEDKRQELLVEKYKYDKIKPKIHISRKDIEQYYHDNYIKFNKPSSITMRIIIVKDQQTADKVDQALGEIGTSGGEDETSNSDEALEITSGDETSGGETSGGFAEVAKKYSIARASQGGALPSPFETELEDFGGFKWDELNAEVRKLSVGQHSPRAEIEVGYGWAYLEDIQEGEKKSLADVTLKIEKILYAQQFDRLSRKYMAELLTDGNFTPIDQMKNALVEVAMSRYAQQN